MADHETLVAMMGTIRLCNEKPGKDGLCDCARIIGREIDAHARRARMAAHADADLRAELAARYGVNPEAAGTWADLVGMVDQEGRKAGLEEAAKMCDRRAGPAHIYRDDAEREADNCADENRALDPVKIAEGKP